MNNSLKISVIGCGWLGWPLAKHLLAEGYKVVGSTRQQSRLETLEAENTGIDLHLFSGDNPLLTDKITPLFSSEIGIICYPPPRTNPEIYATGLQILLEHCEKAGMKKIIFTSSTSVYPDLPQTFDETFDVRQQTGAAHIVAAENILHSMSDKFQINILRLGGLIAADRNPARFLVSERMPNGNAPVNFVHRVDCIGLISNLLQNNIWNKTFNVVADMHPSRREFYQEACKALGRTCPDFPENQPMYQRIISNQLLKKTTNYVFSRSNPLEMLQV